MRISIIIPTRNRRALLEEALASVLGQGYPALEVIVVDDGSEDSTADTVRKLHPDVVLLRSDERHRGRTRNIGLRNATGDYVAFLDDDDVFEPWHVSQFLQHVSQTESEVDHVYWSPANFWNPNTSGELVPIRSKRIPPAVDLASSLVMGTVVPLPSCFIPREVALSCPFPERDEIDGSEDFVFLARLSRRVPFKEMVRPSVRIRVHEGRGMLRHKYIIASRKAAMKHLLEEEFGAAPNAQLERLMIAGTHRFCAALHYEIGEMETARNELRLARGGLTFTHGWILTGKLQLQTYVAPIARKAMARRNQLKKRKGKQ